MLRWLLSLLRWILCKAIAWIIVGGVGWGALSYGFSRVCREESDVRLSSLGPGQSPESLGVLEGWSFAQIDGELLVASGEYWDHCYKLVALGLDHGEGEIVASPSLPGKEAEACFVQEAGALRGIHCGECLTPPELGATAAKSDPGPPPRHLAISPDLRRVLWPKPAVPSTEAPLEKPPEESQLEGDKLSVTSLQVYEFKPGRLDSVATGRFDEPTCPECLTWIDSNRVLVVFPSGVVRLFAVDTGEGEWVGEYRLPNHAQGLAFWKDSLVVSPLRREPVGIVRPTFQKEVLRSLAPAEFSKPLPMKIAVLGQGDQLLVAVVLDQTNVGVFQTKNGQLDPVGRAEPLFGPISALKFLDQHHLVVGGQFEKLRLIRLPRGPASKFTDLRTITGAGTSEALGVWVLGERTVLSFNGDEFATSRFECEGHSTDDPTYDRWLTGWFVLLSIFLAVVPPRPPSKPKNGI